MFCEKRLVERTKRQPFLKQKKIINFNYDMKIGNALVKRLNKIIIRFYFFMYGSKRLTL